MTSSDETTAAATASTATVVEDLAFRARALAQAHALSANAAQYRRWRLERDEADHRVAEISAWAATAFLTGYCVRQVEQSFCGVDVAGLATGLASEQRMLEWERQAGLVAKAMLSGAGGDPSPTLLDHVLVAAALDDVIGREIDKRNEHVREQLSADDWSQFEGFIAWWVMHGYAICTVEYSLLGVTAEGTT